MVSSLMGCVDLARRRKKKKKKSGKPIRSAAAMSEPTTMPEIAPLDS
jgi:hypothetical protein